MSVVDFVYNVQLEKGRRKSGRERDTEGRGRARGEEGKLNRLKLRRQRDTGESKATSTGNECLPDKININDEGDNDKIKEFYHQEMTP